jgi:hypothetical protein
MGGDDPGYSRIIPGRGLYDPLDTETIPNVGKIDYEEI